MLSSLTSRRLRRTASAAALLFLALLLGGVLVLSGCARSTAKRSAEGMQPCPVNNLRVPCMVGPDGKLYRLDRPAEKQDG